MICTDESCTNGKVKCIETRASRGEAVTMRKYQCQTCGNTFFTKEVFDRYPMNGAELQAFRVSNLSKYNHYING